MPAVALGDDQVLELLGRAQIGVREQVDLHEIALRLADRGEVVVALKRRVHIAGRKAARREPIRIDPHAHRERSAAFEGHTLHAWERRQLRLQRARQPSVSAGTSRCVEVKPR